MSIEVISNIEECDYRDKQENQNNSNALKIQHNKHISIEDQISSLKDSKGLYMHKPLNMYNRNLSKNYERLACEIVKSWDRIVSNNVFAPWTKDSTQNSIQALEKLKDTSGRYIQNDNLSRNIYIAENQVIDRFGSRFINPKMFKSRYRNQLNLKLVFSSAASKIGTIDEANKTNNGK